MTRSYFARFAIVAALSCAATSAYGQGQMSDTEKKAAARAAYQEGVKLQDDGKPAEALKRFESAEKLFDAPTHLLHIAECQALTGRLVESAETYESLSHKDLGSSPNEAFKQAQDQARAEVGAVRARIPSIRVTVVTRPPNQQVSGLAINVNGVGMPSELVGIARPLNPGTYRFSAQATGLATASSVDVPLAEKEQKSIELVLVKSGAAGAVVVAPPPPPPGQEPPPYKAGETPPGPKRPGLGTTPFGLLFGVRVGASIPGGNIGKNNGSSVSMSQAAATGAGLGFDVYARLVKMLLLGVTYEHDFLAGASDLSNVPNGQQVSVSAYSNYFGVKLGILPSVDHFSFIGDIGLGSRSMGYKINNAEADLKGLEFDIGVGMSIPIGPIRLAPRASLGIGSFSSGEATGVNGNTVSQDIQSADRDTHVFAFVGLAAYYSLDFGEKPE